MDKKNILIVEDERLIAEDIKRTLIYLGYDVADTVANGKDAIARARESSPDLVLMDIMLEGDINGIEAAEKIYNEMDLPIIFLTAYSNENTLQDARAAQPYGYILKPFEERELHATIEMAFYKHRMQKILKENEKKYRDIFENANESICIIQDKKISFYNPKTTEYLGYPKDKLLSTPFLELVHPEDRDEIGESCKKILEEHQPTEIKAFRMLDINGNPHFFKLNSVPITWENKPATLIFMSDITSQLAAEEEIRKFKVVFDSSNYGMAICDLQGNIEYINKYYANTHGYRTEQLLGKNLAILHNDEQAEKMEESFKKLKESGSFSAIEVWHTRKDKTIFPMLMNGIIIKDSSGKGSFIALSAIDITDRKKSEKIQSQLFEELEHVNDELQNFAYVVSHDLKAPLRAISTLANWISTDYSSKFDQEGQEQMRLLISRVKRMHDLIDGILEYSRVGRIKEETVKIDLNELLEEVIDAIVPPVNIEIKIENKLPEITFERTRITQVFQNLLSNAIKFMDKPKGIIKIGSKIDNGFWKFHISDNGPGIEERHFNKIFMIFQTLQPRDEFESTGIGLTLIKKIINMYDGKIWLESEVGEGTTFYFTLPVNSKMINQKHPTAK